MWPYDLCVIKSPVVRFRGVHLTCLSLAPWSLLPLFSVICYVMNQTRYRDRDVIALCPRGLVILRLGQGGHCLLVFIFFR